MAKQHSNSMDQVQLQCGCEVCAYCLYRLLHQTNNSYHNYHYNYVFYRVATVTAHELMLPITKVSITCSQWLLQKTKCDGKRRRGEVRGGPLDVVGEGGGG